MIYVSPFGGLGNQLFMVAAAIGTARKFGCNYTIDRNWKNAFEFEGKFNLGFEHLNKYTEDWGFHFQPIKKSNVEIYGYFQSEKYFENAKSEIKTLFRPNKYNAEYIKKQYAYLLAQKTMGIHVRRGDYLKFPEYHYNLELEYYTDLMDQFKYEYKFVVFSDDIKWCKRNFNYPDIEFINEGTIIDFQLMCQMDALIMANSTYSWWAGYLAESVVYAPSKCKWFGVQKQLNVDDLYRKSWNYDEC